MKLLLTLGHNASAILVQGENIIIGYEEERLTKVKSDSSFPVLSINRIIEEYPDARHDVKDIFISHWFWDFDLKENKYYRPKYLACNFPNAKITSLDKNFTHHDAHANSVWNYLDGDKEGLTLVLDGFGNYGECMSTYLNGQLQDRCFDLMGSLGLMYQYAIGYLGMKENQDEYKLLGYEQQAPDSFKKEIETKVEKVSNFVLSKLFHGNVEDPYENRYMEGELHYVRNHWYEVFKSIDDFDKKDRPRIAYFVQNVLENVVKKIILKYESKNVKVSGGVFYNVKLNNMIVRMVDLFEANPLSGDQGTALGMTNVKYDHLFFGTRHESYYREIDHVRVIEEIEKNGFCNIMSGSMEFGPRALCNTTCLALPTLEMVEKINTMNGRDTVMPMAPVVTKEYADENFKDTHKVKKSKLFMIIAFDYSKEMSDDIRGAAHIDKDRGVWTGRFQINRNKAIGKVLEHFGGILINTSLNAHGQPIIYDENDFDTMLRIQSEQNDVE
jgi:predicted NodU family carbamoyl transferase